MARWFALDTGFLSDPKVERLVDAHGTEAVAVVIALMSQAMRQERGGDVVLTYRTLGFESHTDKATARAVVESAVEVGLVELVTGDDYEFEARFPAWGRHQASYRKQKSRAAQKASPRANVTDGHAGVTRVSPTRQTDKTGQDRTNKTEESPVPADAPSSEFDEWLADYHQVTGRVSVTGSKGAREAFKARRKEGKTLEDLKFATRGCQSDPWRVEKGHNVPETILRASNVEGYISQAKDRPSRASPAGMSHANRFAEMARRAEMEERQVA